MVDLCERTQKDNMPKRKTSPKKSKPKSCKVEYDEEDISSEHESEEEVSKVDADDAVENNNETLENLPKELPALLRLTAIFQKFIKKQSLDFRKLINVFYIFLFLTTI